MLALLSSLLSKGVHSLSGEIKLRIEEIQGKHGIDHYNGEVRHDHDLRFKYLWKGTRTEEMTTCNKAQSNTSWPELRLPHNLPKDGDPHLF